MGEELQNQLKKLKTQRTQLRRLTTIALKRIEDLFDVEEAKDVDVDAVEESFQVLADRVDRLFKLDDQVTEILVELDSPEDVLVEDYDSVEQYRERWLRITSKRNKLVDTNTVSSKSPSVNNGAHFCDTSSKQKHAKLVRLDPKKFDGSLCNWIGFWSMFKSIDEDKDLNKEQKFQYLIQFTKEGSPAREFLDIFPPSAENYPKALEQFKARFGRPDRLIDMYVRELLKLVLVQATGNGEMTLRTLYDRLVTQLQALESLGVAKDNYAYLLLPLVESALPEPVLRVWQRKRSSKSSGNDFDKTGSAGSDAVPQTGRLNELLSFLQEEVEGDEMMTLARNTFSMKIEGGEAPKQKGNPQKKEPFNKSGKTNTPGQSTPTAAGLMNVKENSSCIFCGGSHPSEACVKCYDMSSDVITKRLSDNGHCFLCFKKGHSRMKCRAVIRCVICSKKHNSVLCESRKSKAAQATEPATSDTLNHNLSNTHHCPILLQTLRVKLRGKSEVEARVMIDCGSQKSYATQRVLSQLEYTPSGTESLVHTLFGGTTNPQVHKRYKLHLASMDRSYFCNFDVLDTKTICLAVPAPTNAQYLAELNAKGISLTDNGDGPIDVLIGADVAGKLWTGRREILPCGLVAMETLLGWTLMGRMMGSAAATCQTYIALMCIEASPSDQCGSDILGIEDPAQKVSKDQNLILAKDSFSKTVKILNGGRYEVNNVPWLPDHTPLQRNFEFACPLSGVQQLQQSLDVHKYVGSHSQLSEVQAFIKHARSVFLKACFDLRGWERKELVKFRWWEGPPWLKLPEAEWPNAAVTKDEEEVLAERREKGVMGMVAPTTLMSSDVVNLRTAEGELIRPITLIKPLDVFSAEDTDLPTSEEEIIASTRPEEEVTSPEEAIQPDDVTTPLMAPEDLAASSSETLPPEIVK